MPPIPKLDDAFLSQLLDPQSSAASILNSNVDRDTLSQVLNKLEASSHAYHTELFVLVHSQLDTFTTSYNTSQDLHSRILDLVHSVAVTHEEVEETQQIVQSTIADYKQVLEASQKNQVKIDALDKLQHMLEIIDLIQQELNQASYIKSVEHLKELARILDTWQDHEGVKQLLQNRIQQLKQRCVLQLQDDVRIAIKYDIGSMRIASPFESSVGHQVSLTEVFDSLDQLDILAEEMMNIQRQIFKHVLHPFLTIVGNENSVPNVNINNLDIGDRVHVIQQQQMTAEQKTPQSMLQQLSTIISYFHQYMFSNNSKDKKALLFGNLLLPELMDAMIEKLISPAIPSTKYNLADFDQITQSVSEFQQLLIQQGFLPAETTTTSLLSYCHNIDKHYAKKRRDKILNDGRKVMLRRVYEHEMIEQQVEGHIYRYQITQTPQILSVLISDTLQEAAELKELHPISAQTLSDGMSDLLDMYRAIMPSYHRQHYLAGPAQSLVFRNDCVWLSKHDSRLNALAQAWHDLTLMHRVNLIQHTLDTLDGFTGMVDNSKFSLDCDAVISRVINLIQHFAAETKPVIDNTLYLDLLSRLVEATLLRLITDIEGLMDIGAEESHIIAVALNSFAQLVECFDEYANDDFVADLVPSWPKFWLLKDILEMNMRDIMQRFRSGDLHMFENKELVGLLCALFADTELREANIVEIHTGVSCAEGELITPQERSFSAQPVSRQQQEISPQMTSSSTASALEYTMDQEDEMDAWGNDDDDDLFIEEEEPVSKLPPMEHIEEPDNEDGGWDDADENIFEEEKQESDKQAETKPTESNAKPISSSLAIQDMDLDQEQGGWGWDEEEDEDLFK